MPNQQSSLIVECRNNKCAVDDDFSYSLQDGSVSDPVVAICRKKTCESAEDVKIYSLQDALIFNGVPISVLVTCPEGKICPPGLYPKVVTYPPGFFYMPTPPLPPGGQSFVLQKMGCKKLVNRILPSTATPQQIDEAAQEIFSDVAKQQAECDQPVFPNSPISVSLSSIEAFACLFGNYENTIVAASSPDIPLSFSISSGSLPLGISISQTGSNKLKISGVPTSVGTSNFSITAAGSENNTSGTGTKSYEIKVVGITTPSPLVNARVGKEYVVNLIQSGIDGIPYWGVVGGVLQLPTWMFLNETTGVLYGTPQPGDDTTSSFSITVTNGVVTCQKDFSITVLPPLPPCPDWTLISWSPPSVATVGSGVGSASGSGAGASASASVGAWPGFGAANTAYASITGTLVSNLAVPATCCLVVSVVEASRVFGVGVSLTVGGALVYQRVIAGVNIGDGTFTVPAGAVTINVSVQASAGSGAGAPPSGDAGSSYASIDFSSCP